MRPRATRTGGSPVRRSADTRWGYGGCAVPSGPPGECLTEVELSCDGDHMSQLDLARLQFAMTSVYHFLFVPVTIGLGFLTALLQTGWHRSGRAELLQLTRFFDRHRA